MSLMHSLYFEIEGTTYKYNTWDSWHLIPSSRPVVAQPTPNYTYVDIPGSNKPLDLSEYLTGELTYQDRKGSFSFYVDNDGSNWAKKRQELANVFNGRKMKMTLFDDSNYFYRGRFFLKEWRSDASSNYSTVTIDYQISPIRYLTNGREAGL